MSPYYKDSCFGDLRVLHSISTMENGGKYHHVSVSRKDRLPTWEELVEIKLKILGDVEAVQMMPTKKDYVNVHQYCLHFWAPIGFVVGLPNLHKIIDERAP